MGNCCHKSSKYGAFRHNLDVPLLEDVIPKLSCDSQVVIIRLAGMSDISTSSNFNGMADAYAELRLMPNDPIAGGQKQLSSIKPNTLNPTWEPPERFQFIVSKVKDSKIVISLYNYNMNNPAKSEALGDAVFKLNDAGLTSTPVNKTVKLISPKDGKQKGEVEVFISIESAQSANNVLEHIVYEFQRWQPILLWGHTAPPGHFLPTDPGRWCSEDGKKFDNEIEYVAPLVKEGWYISEAWHTVSTSTDPDGWQYSTTMTSPYWHPGQESTTYVCRRRTWHRELRRGVAPVGGGPHLGSSSPLRNPSISSSGGGATVSSSTTAGGAAAGTTTGRRKPMFTKAT